ncbi:MAG: hypothetical protein WBC44_01880 [Planctomycetaceae bacterium]
MTSSNKLALFALVPPLLFNPLWIGSYYRHAVVWSSVGDTAIYLEALRGDFQLRLLTGPAEWAASDRFGWKIRAVPNEPNDYSGRQWNWVGFGFAIDLPDEVYDQLRYSLIGCPAWFLCLLLCLPLTLLLMRRRAAMRSLRWRQ